MNIFLPTKHARRIMSSFIVLGLMATTTLLAAPTFAVSGMSDTKMVRIHIKLSDTANIQVEDTRFTGTDSRMLSSSLSSSQAETPKQLFKDTKESLKSDYRAMNNLGNNVTDLSRYYEVNVPEAAATKTLSDLKALPTVVEAYVAPEPTPLPAAITPNLISYQLYRQAAPKGVDATFASTWPGASGDRVKIADLEYSWSTAHEDVSRSRLPGVVINVGTPVDPFNDTRHGTAVLGVIGADSNNFGMTGIAPNAQLRLAATNTLERHWDVAGTIYTASQKLSAGDVMLIEQQARVDSSRPTDFVPIEWYPEVYDALQYANARGIIVVEAAGNGNQNLDRSEYSRAFSANKPDSGAIIVGAGQSCSWSTDRSRVASSTYGKRVNMQGWGECVATTGWMGELWSGGSDRDYTASFGGTSSASAMVAATAASFASAYERLNGVAPTPAFVRSTLVATGSPQVNVSGGNIGPRPNLARALLATDLQAPTAPTKFTGKISKKKPLLSWKSSRDNVAVATYSIYRDGVLLKTIDPTTTFTDMTAKTKKTYKYKVTATDKAGHVSGYSNTISIKTP